LGLERFFEKMVNRKVICFDEFCHRLNAARVGVTGEKRESYGTVASKKFWSSMSFQNLVRLSQIKNFSLPD
jgi:hypothetical protein